MTKTQTRKPARKVTFANGEWYDDDPKQLGACDHAFKMASVIFDGARSIAGKLPDLDLHCERAIRSAEIMGLKPGITASEIARLSREGIKRFDANAELYISPIFYADDGFILPDPASTTFTLSIFEAPIPEPTGFSACLTQYRRPARNMAPTEAKAACLYPNVARGVSEVNAKGFDVGVVLDPNGNVAEFSYTNLFIVKDAVVSTPAINGTFLNGITRQRIIKLLRGAGHTVLERAIDYEEVTAADELFGTGNYAKVSPCTKIEDRALPPGPVFTQARELYFDFVEAS